MHPNPVCNNEIAGAHPNMNIKVAAYDITHLQDLKSYWPNEGPSKTFCAYLHSNMRGQNLWGIFSDNVVWMGWENGVWSNSFNTYM